MKGEGLGARFQRKVRGPGRGPREKAGDMAGPVDVGVRGFGKVILEEKPAYFVVEGVVDTAFTLEGVALGVCAWS